MTSMSTSPTDLARLPTVVITGASSGIGYALALEYLRRGWRVGLTARRVDRLERLREEYGAGRVVVRPLDVDRLAQVAPGLQAMFAELGQVDVVIVNAGINRFSAVGRGDFETEQAILQTNLLGAIATINAAAAWFMAHGGGHLVGIASVAALLGVPKQAAYCASKAALVRYLDSARIELTRHDIRVTQLLPGFVVTDIMPDIARYPFAISAERAAREMADVIARGKSKALVPAFPWAWLQPFLPWIPDGMWRRLR